MRRTVHRGASRRGAYDVCGPPIHHWRAPHSLCFYLAFSLSRRLARASQRSDVKCSAGSGNDPLNWPDTAVGQLQAIYIVKSCGTIVRTYPTPLR